MIATKTLAAIDAGILRTEKEPFRAHLGASVIGKPCARQIWYNYRWTLIEKFEPRMLRLFKDGHHLEPRVHEWLRNAGIEVWHAGEFGKDFLQWARISSHCGHFGGTPDGIIRGVPDLDPKEPCLLEVKTHNDKSFKQLVEEGLLKTKFEHYAQMQSYQGGLKLNFGLYLGYNKDTSAIHPEIIQTSTAQVDHNNRRADQIIFGSEPPARAASNPSHFLCHFCHLKQLCWFGNVTPERNCRTCIHSRPSRDGSGNWLCSYEDMPALNEAAQRAGCGRYQVNPQLHENPK